MPFNQRRKGQHKKTYWTAEETVYIRAWLMIVMAEADTALDHARLIAQHGTDLGGPQLTSHWEGRTACLKQLYIRAEQGIPWKLFDAAVKVVAGLSPEPQVKGA